MIIFACFCSNVTTIFFEFELSFKRPNGSNILLCPILQHRIHTENDVLYMLFMTFDISVMNRSIKLYVLESLTW